MEQHKPRLLLFASSLVGVCISRERRCQLVQMWTDELDPHSTSTSSEVKAVSLASKALVEIRDRYSHEPVRLVVPTIKASS